MIADLYGAKPLESFFPSLAALPSVQTALEDPAIIAKMKAGEALSDEELGAHDIIDDLVHNNCVEADSLEGWSSACNDTFSICIMQFENVFWIAAPEFDDIGYFDTLEEAKAAAECNYEPFITEASEHGKPLESFFPSLAALPSVQTALIQQFGKDGSDIIAKIKAGEWLSVEERRASDTIHDLVHNNSVVAVSLAGRIRADDDTFPIYIMQFGSIFWIQAAESDDIGYFDTLEGVKAAAEFNYGPFVTEASEHKD